jgi:hypothetical protein
VRKVNFTWAMKKTFLYVEDFVMLYKYFFSKWGAFADYHSYWHWFRTPYISVTMMSILIISFPKIYKLEILDISQESQTLYIPYKYVYCRIFHFNYVCALDLAHKKSCGMFVCYYVTSTTDHHHHHDKHTIAVPWVF